MKFACLFTCYCEVCKVLVLFVLCVCTNECREFVAIIYGAVVLRINCLRFSVMYAVLMWSLCSYTSVTRYGSLFSDASFFYQKNFLPCSATDSCSRIVLVFSRWMTWLLCKCISTNIWDLVVRIGATLKLAPFHRQQAVYSLMPRCMRTQPVGTDVKKAKVAHTRRA